MNSVWATELSAGLVPPTTSWCTPLTRCLVMDTITFGGFTNLVKTVVVEVSLRLPLGGRATLTCACIVRIRSVAKRPPPEKRRSQTYITEMFPNFSIENGFSEVDEVWGNPNGDDVSKRAETVLSRIFDDNNSGDCECQVRTDIA